MSADRPIEIEFPSLARSGGERDQEQPSAPQEPEGADDYSWLAAAFADDEDDAGGDDGDGQDVSEPVSEGSPPGDETQVVPPPLQEALPAPNGSPAVRSAEAHLEPEAPLGTVPALETTPGGQRDWPVEPASEPLNGHSSAAGTTEDRPRPEVPPFDAVPPVRPDADLPAEDPTPQVLGERIPGKEEEKEEADEVAAEAVSSRAEVPADAVSGQDEARADENRRDEEKPPGLKRRPGFREELLAAFSQIYQK